MQAYTNLRDYDHAQKMANGFHFTIDVNGNWYCHDPRMGVGPILRNAIAGLFSGAGEGFMRGKGLRRHKNGLYELYAPPNDIYGVDVEDVPFIMVQSVVDGSHIVFTTQFGETVCVEAKDFIYHPAGLFPGVPYVMVRDGLQARLHRNVFYELVERGVVKG